MRCDSLPATRAPCIRGNIGGTKTHAHLLWPHWDGLRFPRQATHCKLTMPTSFSELLQTLPPVQHLQALELLDANGHVLARIENQPGSSGSVRVYAALAAEFGVLNAAAAQRGLALFAEHTAAARAHPGSHPNIDRLLALADSQEIITVRLCP